MNKEELAYIDKVGNDPKNLDIDLEILIDEVLVKYPHLDRTEVHKAMFLAIIGI